jgi:hypothetical protein
LTPDSRSFRPPAPDVRHPPRRARSRCPSVRRALAAAPASSRRHAELDYRPSYKAAGVVALAVFGLYLLTLAPSTAMWDASEYIAAAYVLGIPHPPGNPFFMLSGGCSRSCPIAPNVAMRINVLAALCSAVAAGVWFLVAERVLVSWLARAVAAHRRRRAAALIGATAFTVWNQSVVNEKVYTVSLLFFAIVSWLVVRWCDEPDAPEGRPAARARRVPDRARLHQPPGRPARRPGGGRGGAAAPPPLTLLNWRLLLEGRARLRARPHAVHLPADPRRALPGDQRGRAHGVHRRRSASTAPSTRPPGRGSRRTSTASSTASRRSPSGRRRSRRRSDMWWLYFKWQWIRDAHGEHRRCRARSPCSSSRSASSAATCTGSATGRASGSSGRSCSR